MAPMCRVDLESARICSEATIKTFLFSHFDRVYLNIVIPSDERSEESRDRMAVRSLDSSLPLAESKGSR